MNATDLSALTRGGSGVGSAIPRPRRRVATRVLVPLAVVVAACGLLGYAARESLRPVVSVRTAPVVLAERGAGGEAGRSAPGQVVQAPGWIEADPYAVAVPALTAGVLREVLVLEGQRVEKGQAVARLVDEDAVLGKKRAASALATAGVAIEEARATLTVEEARTAEMQDASDRVARLAGTGAVGEGEIVARRTRLDAQKAAVKSAETAIRRAEAERDSSRVMLEEAELALARTEVRSPVAGVVLARLVEPGQRVMPDANNMFAGVVVRVYDPEKLQVRVDVPLADAGKVGIGDAVEVTTETMPDRVFHGTVTRFVSEANVQKNTVQVKVGISDPAPELKPEMLAKARIATRGHGETKGGAPVVSGGAVVLAPKGAVLELSGERGAAWVVDLATGTAAKREVRVGRVVMREGAEAIEVLEGLRAGDRVILEPPVGLAPGTRVKAIDVMEGR